MSSRNTLTCLSTVDGRFDARGVVLLERFHMRENLAQLFGEGSFSLRDSIRANFATFSTSCFVISMFLFPLPTQDFKMVFHRCGDVAGEMAD